MTTAVTPSGCGVERRTVTRAELSRMLGVSLDTIDRRRADLPPAVRVGRQWLWDRGVVEDFLRNGVATK